MSENEVLDAMHEVAPRDWWRFVPCRTCNSPRGEECQTAGLERRRDPHAARYRLGLAVHATFWLVRNFPGDVLGENRAESHAKAPLAAERGEVGSRCVRDADGATEGGKR